MTRTNVHEHVRYVQGLYYLTSTAFLDASPAAAASLANSENLTACDSSERNKVLRQQNARALQP
jgi:hypothetical protein